MTPTPSDEPTAGAPSEERTARDLVPTLEALLFVSGEAVTLRQIQTAIPGASRQLVIEALDLLAEDLSREMSGIQLQAVAGGHRLVTKPEQDAWIRAFTAQRRKQKLSGAARETLTIVAYKQPITAPEMTEIRGVDCTSALKSLLERKLVRILGRKEVVGRPILYGTTKEFLALFGLKALEDLPTLEEFEDLSSGVGIAGATGGAAGADRPPEQPRDASEAHDLLLAEANRRSREQSVGDEESVDDDEEASDQHTDEREDEGEE